MYEKNKINGTKVKDDQRLQMNAYLTKAAKNSKNIGTKNLK
jgi:hypothetical protein